MKEQAENKKPIDPLQWLQAAEKLNAVMGDDIDILLDLRMTVAKLRMESIASGKTVSYAKAVVEASEEYTSMKRQEAKIEQIKESIRLAKHHARLKSDEMRSNL